MHRVRTSTNKFATGRIRKTKKAKSRTVLRDSQRTNIIRNGLFNSETEIPQRDNEKGDDYVASIRRNQPEPLDSDSELSDNTFYEDIEREDTEREDTEREDIDDTYAEGATYDNDSFNEPRLSLSFPNISIFLIFIWITKHMIGITYDRLVKPVVSFCNSIRVIAGTSAYKDLISILKHPQFHISELPNDISIVKKYRSKLPLMPISSISVPISQKDTPSNSETTKEAYYFSILNHIERILNNPYLRNHMYFDAGVKASNKSELWHGTLWHESPLFGIVTISYNNGENNNISLLVVLLIYLIYFMISNL